MKDRIARRKEDAQTRAEIDKLLPPPPPKTVRKRRRRKPILNRKEDAEDAVRGASMDIIRDAMSAEIRAWMGAQVPEGKRRFLLLQQDTGTGKTETTLAVVEFMVHLTAHGGLADEAFGRAAAMGNSAMRWRARSWGWEEVLDMARINPEVSEISDQGRERLIELCFPNLMRYLRGRCARSTSKRNGLSTVVIRFLKSYVADVLRGRFARLRGISLNLRRRRRWINSLFPCPICNW